GGRGARGVRVEAVAGADAGKDDAGRAQLALGVQHQRLADAAAQIPRLGEPLEPSAELLVDDVGTVTGQPLDRLGDRNPEDVRLQLPGQRDLDRDGHRAAMLSDQLSSLRRVWKLDQRGAQLSSKGTDTGVEDGDCSAAVSA